MTPCQTAGEAITPPSSLPLRKMASGLLTAWRLALARTFANVSSLGAVFLHMREAGRRNSATPAEFPFASTTFSVTRSNSSNGLGRS